MANPLPATLPRPNLPPISIQSMSSPPPRSVCTPHPKHIVAILAPMCREQAPPQQGTCRGCSGVGLRFGGMYSPISWDLTMEIDVVDLGNEHVPFDKGLAFVIEETLKDLRNGEALVSYLEVCASTTAQKDSNTRLEYGGKKGLGCGMSLSKFYERSCRSPPPPPPGPLIGLTFLGRRKPTRDEAGARIHARPLSPGHAP